MDVTVPIETSGVRNAFDENFDIPRILLVEDYPANILVATSYLDHFGYAYDVASNGMEAFEKAKSGNYAAILMDVQMPGLNGYETTRIIRAHERQHGKPPVRIIGMTAHALVGDEAHCIAEGMDDYISKPFNPTLLKNKLAATMGAAANAA